MESKDILLVAASFLILLSLYLLRKKKVNISIAALVIAGCVLRLYVSLDPYLHTWDEQFHAVVAKHLLVHPFVPALYDKPLLPLDFRNWWESGIWLHKPPLPLWFMSLGIALFGQNELAVRLPSIILSTTAIFLTWVIGKELFNRNVGWLAAFFMAVNGFIIEITGGRIATDHIDVCFFFFVELAVVFAILQRKTGRTFFILPFSVSLTCAIYSKWLPALIVLIIWWVLNFEREKVRRMIVHAAVNILLVIVLVLPWQLYIFHAFPQEARWESLATLKHITTVLDGQTGPWYLYLVTATINWNELIWLGFLWVIWKYYKRKWKREYAALILWVIIPFVFFSVAKTKMMGYVLFAAPPLFLMLAVFWFDWKSIAAIKPKRKWYIYMVLSAIIVLSIRYSIERIKPFQSDKNKIELAAKIKKLGASLTGERIVIFNAQEPMYFMFYTDFIAYNQMPSAETINVISSEGYKVFILDNGFVPDSLKSNSRVTLLNF